MTSGLGVAQLGELGGHVRHRAVVLAELAAGGDRGRVRQRSPPAVSASASASARAIGIVAGLAQRGPAALLERGDLRFGERAHRIGPPCSAIQRSAAVATPS
jgi:hypothetical protein